MICTSFLWCIFFFTTFGFSWGYEDPFLLPACEDKGLDDVYLDFSNGNFYQLSKSSMLESTIKCLNYERSNIHEIDRDAFDNVPELYYLNLGGNPIKFDDFIRTDIQNLKTLILDGPFNYDDYRNSERGVDYGNYENTFSLPKLKKLSLRNYGGHYSQRSNYRLSTLRSPMLTHLYLSGNGISTIANLEDMPNLTHLNLDDNTMSYISGSFLKNLEYLSMNRNNIGKVCRTYCSLHSISPRGMHNLKYLSLADNKIRNIDSDAFADLENLLILNLAENEINDFEKHTFDNVTMLQNLTLDKNQLTKVPDVSALQELQILSLNENKIMVINEMTFCDMPKLTMVFLRKNGLTTIADMAFGNLPALTTLDFSWNSINFLPEEWILPNNSVKVLRLDGNKFTDMGNMTLEQLHNLNVLGLAYNPIKKISARYIRKLAADVEIDITLDSSARKARLNGINQEEYQD